MIQRTIAILILGAAVFAGGCSKKESKDDVAKEMMATLQELEATLDKASDEATAKDAVPKVRELATRWKAQGERAKKAEDQLGEQQKLGLAKAMLALTKHILRINLNPKLKAILSEPLAEFSFGS